MEREETDRECCFTLIDVCRVLRFPCCSRPTLPDTNQANGGRERGKARGKERLRKREREKERGRGRERGSLPRLMTSGPYRTIKDPSST